MQFILKVPSDVCIKITPQKPLSRELPQKQISFYTFAINSTRLLSGKLLCVMVAATKMSTNKNKNSNCTRREKKDTHNQRENQFSPLQGPNTHTRTHGNTATSILYSLFVLFLGYFFFAILNLYSICTHNIMS